MRGATRAGRHQRGAVAREAGDAMDACGLDGFGQGHRRQDERRWASIDLPAQGGRAGGGSVQNTGIHFSFTRDASSTKGSRD